MKTGLRSSFFALELALGVFFLSFSLFLAASGDFSFFPSGGDREIGTITFFASFFWRCKLDDLCVKDFGWLVSTLDRTFRKADWLRGFWAWFGFGLAQNWRNRHVNNERSLIRSRSFSIPIDNFIKNSVKNYTLTGDSDVGDIDHGDFFKMSVAKSLTVSPY